MRQRVALQPDLYENVDMGIADVQRSLYGTGIFTNEGKAPDFSSVNLFAGIGGMRLGFEAASSACVFTCEWDMHSQQTYRANFDEDEIEVKIWFPKSLP